METEERHRTARLLLVRKIRLILDCFSLDQPVLSLREIRSASGLPASTCQRLVQNLVAEGFLERDAAGYRIGLGVIRWSAAGAAALDIVRLAQEPLRELRDITSESAVLYIRDGILRTVVAMAKGRHAVTSELTVGMVVPVDRGSAGKVMLAYDRACRRELVRSGAPGPEDAELLEIRRSGWAATHEDRAPGVASISAPVLDHLGQLAAALGIVAPLVRLTDPEIVDAYAQHVCAAAAQLSTDLGHTGAVVANEPVSL